MAKSNLCCLLAIVFGLGATAFMISTIVVAVKLKDEQNNNEKLEAKIDAMAKTDAPAPTSPPVAATSAPTAFVNICDGKKSDVDLANVNCTDVGVTPQAGANVTKGYVGQYAGAPKMGDGTPITTSLAQAGLCPVNVHWHLGAEHVSNGEYDMDGNGPSEVAERRRLAGKVDPGGQCYLYDEDDDMFKNDYVWKHCTNMEVGQTYEVHWPHSVHGACDTDNQYQEPFYDGVFCHFKENGKMGKYADVPLSHQIGVQAQVFVVVNDENFYEEDLFKGMIVNATSGTGKDIAYYTGSTTGQSRNNTICSQYGPITWQVDRKCNKISASSFDNMCKTMKAQRDETLGSKDTHPHGSRVVVSDILADQQIP